MTTPSDTLEYLEGTYGINYDLCCQCGRVAPTGIIRVDKYIRGDRDASTLGGGWFFIGVYRPAADGELELAFSKLTTTVDLSRWRFFPNVKWATDLLRELRAQQTDHFKVCPLAYAGVPGEGFAFFASLIPSRDRGWGLPERQGDQDQVQPIASVQDQILARNISLPLGVTSVRAGR